ncbi:uncharacterized protein C8A04DRAFT_24889 [Dichotomopilus funicola]|uniref:Uncharacterized protein n=1 Tax=Dichotomopilus funicola TaxID=1934379 RepID=A0AAN6ZPN3_9PEZI|nr:hypothetical protein C8A04DRAFT_24889 [Dichotomopilus funicola]
MRCFRNVGRQASSSLISTASPQLASPVRCFTQSALRPPPNQPKRGIDDNPPAPRPSSQKDNYRRLTAKYNPRKHSRRPGIDDSIRPFHSNPTENKGQQQQPAQPQPPQPLSQPQEQEQEQEQDQQAPQPPQQQQGQPESEQQQQEQQQQPHPNAQPRRLAKERRTPVSELSAVQQALAATPEEEIPPIDPFEVLFYKRKVSIPVQFRGPQMQDGGERIVSIQHAQSESGDLAEATAGGDGEAANNGGVGAVGNNINDILETLAKRDEDLIVREKRLLKAERRVETRWELVKESMAVFNTRVDHVIKLCDKLLEDQGKKPEDTLPGEDIMEMQVDKKEEAEAEMPGVQQPTTEQVKTAREARARKLKVELKRHAGGEGINAKALD